MSDSDASYDDYCASDDSDAMSGSDADEYLVLDDETYGDIAASASATPWRGSPRCCRYPRRRPHPCSARTSGT
jgi:hypothetical protein